MLFSVCAAVPEAVTGDAAALSLVAVAKEKEAGDAGFASWLALVGLLSVEVKEKDEGDGDGDETGLFEAFAKLNADLVGSAGVFSALRPEDPASCLFSSLPTFVALSAWFPDGPDGARVEVDAGALPVGLLLLPNENGWLPKEAPALKSGLKELNAEVAAGGDDALAASPPLPASTSIVALPAEAAAGLKENGLEAVSPFGV